MSAPTSSQPSSQNVNRTVVGLGTRASQLALVQTHLVADALRLSHASTSSSSAAVATNGVPSELEFVVKPMSVAGDRNKQTPLYLLSAENEFAETKASTTATATAAATNNNNLTVPSAIDRSLSTVSSSDSLLDPSLRTTTTTTAPTAPLLQTPAKSLWTVELEEALLAYSVDMIVHSCKDVPTTLPDGCEIGAILPREDPHDALVVKEGLRDTYKTLKDLPEGSVVGTSSVRRIAQLRRWYPSLKIIDVRGNM